MSDGRMSFVGHGEGRHGRASFVVAAVLVVLCGFAIGAAQAAPVLIATKTDTLIVDVDGDNLADPGDTIRYTVRIEQSGSTNAESVVFTDTIDSNSTLVAGSLRTTPIARNDQYASLGNVGITVPSTGGVLVNDNDPDGSAISVLPSAGGTASGGAYSIGADGAFSYLPPSGFEGTDSFFYSIQDTDGNQDLATVFVVVTELIWFIDNSASSPGSGALTTPLNTISAFNAKQTGTAPGAKDGDVVFLHEGSGNYASGIILRNGQILIGQGASSSIAAIAGITVPPFSNALPATGGTAPIITTTSGDGVLVAQNNTLRGFDVGNTTGVGISDNGGAVGTLNIFEVAITGTGGGIEADNGGTLAVTLESLAASSSSDEGIDLENVSGSFTVAASTGTITTTGVPAVVVDGNPTITLGVTLQSVGATNATHGISLRDTTGGFAITGTGGTGTGGTLSGHSGEGVLLADTGGISLTGMAIDQSTTNGTQGIDAGHVDGLTLNDTTITAGSGNSYALLGTTIRNLVATDTIFDGGGGSVPNIDGVRITNLLGASSITDSTFRNGKDINLLIENNTNGGGLDTIGIAGSSFSNSAGGDHLQVEADGTANPKLVVGASSAGDTTFSGTGQDGIQLEAEGNATLQAVVTDATFTNTLGSAINLDAVSNGQLIARIHDLTGLTSTGTNVINAIGFDTSVIDVTIENNTITSATAGNGIRVIQEGNGTVTADITANTIDGVTQGNGILLQARAGTGGNGRINATIDNNSVSTTGTLSLDGIEVTSGSSAGGDTNTICLNLLNNTSASGAFDGYFLRQRTGSTFQLQDFAGAATSAGITTWVNTTKSNTGSVFVSGASNFTAAPAACATPTVPTAMFAGVTGVVESDGLDDGKTVARPSTTISSADTQSTETVVRTTDDSTPISILSGESITVTLGTLDPDQVVAITFDVTIDSPQSPATNAQVCNQAVVSGTNSANVLSDDPEVGGSLDPTCTLLAPGKIVIVKDQSPDGNDTFGFTSTIPGKPTFLVTGDNSTTFDDVTPGTYSVTEDDPTASFFTLARLSCDDGASGAASTTDLATRTATISVESGETVTCTFTNDQIGNLKVVKSVDATPTGETFDLLIDGDVEASGVGDGGTTGAVAVAIGDHSVSETGTNLANYDTSITCVLDGTTSIVAAGPGTSLDGIPVGAGDAVVCTITNIHKTGNLEVVKRLLPATDTGSFDLRIDTTAHVATGGDGTTTGEQAVPIGSRLVSETGDGPTNLNDYVVGVECRHDDGTGAVVAATPAGALAWDVDVAEGDDIVCVITNQRKGTITIVKDADPADDTAFSFTHDISGGGGFTLQDPSDGIETFTDLTPGHYTVMEAAPPAGWSLGDIDCVEDQTSNSAEDLANAQAQITLDPGETVTCTFNNAFNRAPVAIDDSYETIEDTPLAVVAPGVLDNDTDADADPLTATLDTGPGNGTLTLDGDGSFVYTPAPDFCGDDSFTYHANDGIADSNVAMVDIDVDCVDDPPVVSVDTTTQTVQYSDSIVPVTVTATDVDSHPLTISDDAPFDLSTSGGCTAAGDGTACTWTLSGQALVAAGTDTVTFTVSDATNDATDTTEIVVVPEDATVAFDAGNEVAIEVDAAGSDSSLPFTLAVHVREKTPDQAAGSASPGDINLADVAMALTPVGPGSPVTVACTSTGAVPAFDYKAVLTAECDFSGVAVNTYTAEVTVAGGYYTGSGEDALVVYDSSLGFTTGGGWFYWPGTADPTTGYPGDRTNFGYTMKYNKKGKNLRGNLLVIRHTTDGIYRLKSNALDGLAIGSGGDFDWATFTGKATYLEPGWADAVGNYEFVVYVEDHGTPGAGSDRFWVSAERSGTPASGQSVSDPAQANAVVLGGGSIVVPHQGDSKGPKAR